MMKSKDEGGRMKDEIGRRFFLFFIPA